MTTNELQEKIKNLRELNRMAEEITHMIETIKDEIKAEMTAQNTDTLTGTDFKVTWSSIISTRFNTTSFKKTHPELYSEFCETSTTKRFLLK